jgi:hypothetical protein
VSISQVSTTWLDVYRGNPDIAVLSIDTSGGIAMSRTTGQCPAFVQVSARDISGLPDPGNLLEMRPYEDFYFEWDFGDPDGTEIFTDPREGSVNIGDFNLNNRQTAPEAVYCYREPGTYTITLTVRAKKGDGLILRRSVTAEFTATAFNASNGTYYFDSVAGSDSNDGLTSSTPKQTGSALASLATTTDRAFFIKRGSSYNTQININSRQRWSDYGTGDKPTFSIPTGMNYAFGREGNPTNSEDIVVRNFDFRGGDVTSTKNFVRFFTFSGLIKDLYLEGLETTNPDYQGGINIQSGVKSGANMSTNCGIYRAAISTNLTPWLAINGGGYAYGSSLWNFVVGSYFEGAGGQVDGTTHFTHHLYMQCKEHGCYLLNDFGYGTGKRSCYNLNWDWAVVGVPETARCHAISYCNMRGTGYAFDFGTGSSTDVNGLSQIQYIDSVAQDNAIHDMAIGAWYFQAGRKVSLRDQNVWGIATPNTNAGPAAYLSLRLYRHNWYNESPASSGAQMPILGDLWAEPLQFVDNKIVDMRGSVGSANLICMHVATHLANESLIDRNQYYAPNDAGIKMGTATHNSPTVTFAGWQAAGADPNGSEGNPGWTDPANGDFS